MPGFPKIIDALLNKTVVDEDVEEANNSECTVCSNAPMDYKLDPCNHTVMCHDCAQKWISENKNCPVCHMAVLARQGENNK